MNGRLWEHHVIRDHHTMTMTRDYPAGIAHSVATCKCGWTNTVAATAFTDQDDAIRTHWQTAIDGRT